MVKVGKKILLELIEEGFFDEWRAMNEIVKRLSQRGFTISGKKIGNLGQTLTRICRDKTIGLEREEVSDIDSEKTGGIWKYKKVR
jgi:EAL domain-containing protein (putative c-di-GMP-specific phosphodiesterase class I)